MAKKRVHVISNTHWDREHRHGFQETTCMLVETMDKLIEIMEADPAFKYFTLDGQVLPVEDYLVMKPHMRARLEKLIRDGRILVGPWYSLPDHFSCHPEALVRNLLIGHRVCAEYGEPTKFGYSIFSFSQIAQLPQLYEGFGIDTLIFYKFYPLHLLEKSEFYWEAPDGTKALCSRLGLLARSNFFFEFTIPVILGGDANRTNWDIEFTGPGKLCRLIDECYEHPYATEIEQDIRIRKEQIPESIQRTVDSCTAESFSQDVLLAFDGCDFTAPLAELPEAIRLANEMSDDVEMIHSRPLDYFEEFRNATDLTQLPTVSGEMRYGPLSRQHCELMGTAIKIIHAMNRAESLLIHTAEPFSAFGALLGNFYPRDILRFAWKLLLQCQAHDTPHGIGVPKIQPDAIYRLAQVQELAESISTRAIHGLISRIDTTQEADDAILVTVFNPTPQVRSEIMTLNLELPRSENIVDYWLEDMDGNRITMYEYNRKSKNLVSINNENRPKALFVDPVEIDVDVQDVPAYGYKTYRLLRGKNPVMPKPHPFPDPVDPYRPIGIMPNILDNGLLRVTINSNGTIDVTDLESGRTTTGLHLFLDTGDAGDMWIHRKPRNNRFISSLNALAEIALVRTSALSSTFRIEVTMNIPESLTQDRLSRSEHCVPTKITTELTLRKNSKRIEFVTTYENRCKDHMLTVRFPTGLQNDKLVSDVAFEVRERDVEHITEKQKCVRGDELRRQPKFRYIDVTDGTSGLAIFGKGQNEYEPHQIDGVTIDLTLMRSMTQKFPVHSDVFLEYENEESQSQGEHTFSYALYFHKGDFKDGDVQNEAVRYITPALAAQYGRGGNGDCPLDSRLPLEASFISLANPVTNISGIKLAEDDDALIVRLNNPTDSAITDTVKLLNTPATAELVNLNEEHLEDLAIASDGTIQVNLAPYKIVTLKFTF